MESIYIIKKKKKNGIDIARMEQIKNKLTINSLDEAIWLLELLIITI
jgi:hypothetical protein